MISNIKSTYQLQKQKNEYGKRCKIILKQYLLKYPKVYKFVSIKYKQLFHETFNINQIDTWWEICLWISQYDYDSIPKSLFQIISTIFQIVKQLKAIRLQEQKLIEIKTKENNLILEKQIEERKLGKKGAIYKYKKVIKANEKMITFDYKMFGGDKPSDQKYIQNFQDNFQEILQQNFNINDEQKGIIASIFQSHQRLKKNINNKESLQIRNKLQKQLKQVNPLLILSKSLQSQGRKVSYSKKQNPLTTLSLYNIFTHFGNNEFKLTSQVKLNTNKNWNIDRYNMSENMEQLKYKVQETLSEHHQVSIDDVQVVSLRKINQQLVEAQYFVKYFGQLKSGKSVNIIQKHQLFQVLSLNIKDFTTNNKGNIDFITQYKAKKMVRGGYPYYQPNGWKRYGLNIQKYNQQGSDWLAMNGNSNQWAVMYHGLKDANNSVQKIIENGMFKRGGTRQAYDTSNLFISKQLIQALDKKGINLESYYKKISDELRCETQIKCESKVQNQNQIGIGTYGSPLINTTCNKFMDLVKYNGKEYYIAFQCRVDPTEIRIPDNKRDYWLIRHSKYIRPYGLLITEACHLNTQENKKLSQQFQKDYQLTFASQYNKFKKKQIVETIQQIRQWCSFKVDCLIL